MVTDLVTFAFFTAVFFTAAFLVAAAWCARTADLAALVFKAVAAGVAMSVVERKTLPSRCSRHAGDA